MYGQQQRHFRVSLDEEQLASGNYRARTATRKRGNCKLSNKWVMTSCIQLRFKCKRSFQGAGNELQTRAY